MATKVLIIGNEEEILILTKAIKELNNINADIVIYKGSSYGVIAPSSFGKSDLQHFISSKSQLEIVKCNKEDIVPLNEIIPENLPRSEPLILKPILIEEYEPNPINFRELRANRVQKKKFYNNIQKRHKY